MEEIVKLSLLYDFYGELLTNHQKSIYEDYFFNNIGLSEIAEERGTSRQAVHDMVKRCEKLLQGYEDKLHLVEKFMTIRDKVQKIDELLDGYESDNAQEIVQNIRRISDEIIEEL